MTFKARMKLGIGIASSGRTEQLTKLLDYFYTHCSYLPIIYICTPNKSPKPLHPPDLCVKWLISSQPGLCLQRNIILEAAKTEDFLVFFDDDFLPRDDYLENLREFVSQMPSSFSVLTGTVIQDGVTSGGISFEQAIMTLQKSYARHFSSTPTHVFNGYGCNMVLNMNHVRKYGVRFDLNLPQYGWLEDVEFSLQMKRFGQVVKLGNTIGVHLGSPAGRQGARRLGYSQIANPYYICKKHKLGKIIFLNYFIFRFLKNLFGALRGNQVRRDRCHGNVEALLHLWRGNIDPQWISEIS